MKSWKITISNHTYPHQVLSGRSFPLASGSCCIWMLSWLQSSQGLQVPAYWSLWYSCDPRFCSAAVTQLVGLYHTKENMYLISLILLCCRQACVYIIVKAELKYKGITEEFFMIGDWNRKREFSSKLDVLKLSRRKDVSVEQGRVQRARCGGGGCVFGAHFLCLFHAYGQGWDQRWNGREWGDIQNRGKDMKMISKNYPYFTFPLHPFFLISILQFKCFVKERNIQQIQSEYTNAYPVPQSPAAERSVTCQLKNWRRRTRK